MSEITLEGLDEFQEMLESMTLTESDERSSMRKAIKVIADKVEDESPKGETGKLSKVSASVKKDGFGMAGEVKTGAYWDVFMNFGTSYQKSHVGYFDRAVQSVENEALEILVRELLSKAK